MNLADIAKIRLFNQQIEGAKFIKVKEIVNWMGALQAQDYAMAKWAIGLRLPGSAEKVIDAAIDKGEILRTHLLRTTWHFISADDIYWMLALRSDQIKTSLITRHKQLELSTSVIAKSNAILEKAMRGGRNLTREEILGEFGKAHIALDENRASHIMLRAELDGIVCSGAAKNGKLTYALLDERVPRTMTLTKEEALAKVAKKYFSSHGPASLQDFIWWSGLSVGEAKQALELVKSNFISEIIDSEWYWFPNYSSKHMSDHESVHLLPAFDEFIISYKDRRAMLPYIDFNKVVSNNGIFRPVIVVNGQVQGIWKRTIKKGRVILETQLFKEPDQTILHLIRKALLAYGLFLEKEIEMNQYSSPSNAL